jgi:hypothetical protein
MFELMINSDLIRDRTGRQFEPTRKRPSAPQSTPGRVTAATERRPLRSAARAVFARRAFG